MRPSSPEDPELAPLRSAAGLLALRSLPGIGPRGALRIALGASSAPLRGASLDAARRAAEECLLAHREAGIEVLGYFDRRYPPRLKEIADPPPLLFLNGEHKLLAARQMVAVVGSRDPSPAAAAAAESLAASLAAAGWGLVSGLAAGVDVAAHRGAARAGAPDVAVLGGGLDKVSPASSRPLAREILASGGALLAEQPLGAATLPAGLVRRNRLQSGLSAAVVIAGSSLAGGTMHTARFAAEQGRPVLAPVLPGEDRRDEGARALLARPARSLCELSSAWRGRRSLCERLGPRPLAHPIAPETAVTDIAAALAAVHARSAQLPLDL